MTETGEIRQKDGSSGNLTFPKQVILIVIFQYSVKFSFNTLRGVLPLYFVDILDYTDDEATVLFHAFTAFLFAFCVVGGIIADSLLGKYRCILLFGATFATGLVVLSASATPPLNLPIRAFTIIGLFVTSFGYGAIRPCTVAFGGNQFVLPQQEKQLSLLFVFLCIGENVASMCVSFVIPVLRKDITCYGQLTCYSAVFILPAVLLFVAIVMIFATKRFYKIYKPEGNVLVLVTKCVYYAIQQRFKTKEKHDHWLNYAEGKCEPKLIEDIKSVSSILKLLLPLTLFWSLYSLPASLWTFQMSRMDGEIAGYVVKPDQIQLVNSISVITFISTFNPYVYPFLAKFFALNTPLRRITLGCFVAAIAYYTSGIIELNLEKTYAKTPTKGLAQMRIYNTLDCKVSMTIDEHQSFVIHELDVFQKIDIVTDGKRILKYKKDYSNCNNSKIASGQIEVTENQATSWALTKNGLGYKFIDRIDKSNSGNPLVRALIYVDDDVTTNDLHLNLVSKGKTLERFRIPDKFTTTGFKEVAHKHYDMYLNDRLVESDVPLRIGGVYTILGRVSKSSVNTRTVAVTQPNSLHILWILPQQVFMAAAEIMVNVLVMEFAYSQAPTSMKAFLQSYWLFLGLFGNLLVIAITEAQLFERKVYVIFLYAFLMTLSGIAFGILAKFYKIKEPVADNPKRNISQDITKNKKLKSIESK